MEQVCYLVGAHKKISATSCEFCYWELMPQSDLWDVFCQFWRKLTRLKWDSMCQSSRLMGVPDNVTSATKINSLFRNNRSVSWVPFASCEQYHIVCSLRNSSKVKCLDSLSDKMIVVVIALTWNAYVIGIWENVVCYFFSEINFKQ